MRFPLLLLCVSLILLVSPILQVTAIRTTRIRLALKQANIQQLESELYAVSDPASPRYGQHLTHDDIRAIIGTTPKEVRQIKKWFHQHPKIQSPKETMHLHSTGDYLDIDVPVAIAEAIVGDAGQRQRLGEKAVLGEHEFASESIFQNLIDFAIHLDPSHHTLLREIQDSKSEFADWDKLPSLAVRRASYALKQLESEKQKKKASKASVLRRRIGSNDASSGTPAAQLAAYGVPAGTTCTNPKTTQLVWGTGTYGFTQSDLVQYYSAMNIDAGEINKLVVTDFPGKQGGDNWGEGTLDVSLISGLAPNALTLVSNTDTSSGAEEGDGFGPAMLKWLTDLVDRTGSSTGSYPLPQTISLSLGSLSWDSCNILCTGAANAGANITYSQCQDYMQQQRQVCMYPDSDGLDRMNVEFMKLGAMGTTALAATGDGGSHFSFQFFNPDPIGSVLNQVACKMNFPTFPAESPYVVGVGGIDWSQGGSSAPVAWSASGGGFSWRYPRPQYQEQAVETYFTRVHLPPLTAFNSSNRAYPDVAALAANVPVVFAGSLTPAAGTSCSAPEFTALITLLNDKRMNSGLNPLGFILPALYKLSNNPSIYSEMFYDMSTGNSDCDGNNVCCNQGTGFDAAVGWDVTTGLGAPKFQGLEKYLGSNEFLKMFQ